MTNPFHGVRGRVTFTVLVVSAVLYSLLGTVGFVRIASSGRAAIEERIEEVLDQVELAVRSGSGTTNLSTADGVTATVLPAGTTTTAPPGTLQVVREVEVGGTELLLVGISSQDRLTESLRSLYRGLWLAIPLASIVTALM
ncbi:MAG: hypothetical protein RL238_805, partial [Actinomycetota bacterium]